MHEMALCYETVSILVEQANKHKVNKVTAVWLEVSAFSCVETEALHFCFGEACKNTVLEGATLHIIKTAGQGWCFECSQKVELMSFDSSCPVCGSVQLQKKQNDSLRIKEIEVE